MIKVTSVRDDHVLEAKCNKVVKTVRSTEVFHQFSSSCFSRIFTSILHYDTPADTMERDNFVLFSDFFFFLSWLRLNEAVVVVEISKITIVFLSLVNKILKQNTSLSTTIIDTQFRKVRLTPRRQTRP